MKIAKFVKKLFQSINIKYTLNNRKKYWRKIFKKNIDKSTKLSKIQIKEIKNYYSEYCKINTLFHDFYYQKTGLYSKYYIPDDLYYTKIDPFYNNWEEAYYLDNKCYYDKLFSNVPQPKTILKRMNDIYYDKDNNIIDKNQAFKIVKNKNNYFLKKATDSEGGHGVFYIKKYEDFVNNISKIKTDLIVQESLSQCSELNKLHDNSINTIRVLSLISNNKVHIVSTILRMGIGDSKVDNASSGGITCGINKSGRLKEIAYASNGKSYTRHPTSNVSFGDIIIPNYDKIIKLVEKLAITMPHFRLVSWDIAINSDNNPILVEANLRYGELDFHQLNNGPLFGDMTDLILKEVFKGDER